ncbi:MAG: (2Fe-2S)-binding protein, partial [Sulfuricaulis sp.]|nr:(2Fe-2S)-binding protein [Sulfuricaulis sp.]
AGTLPSQASALSGGIVCACFNVSKNAIIDVIREKRLSSLDEVGQCLKVGTNCGSCLPELKAILRQARPAA